MASNDASATSLLSKCGRTSHQGQNPVHLAPWGGSSKWHSLPNKYVFDAASVSLATFSSEQVCPSPQFLCLGLQGNWSRVSVWRSSIPQRTSTSVMVSISLAPDWKKVCVCVCVRSDVCFALFIARRSPSSCRQGAAVTSSPQRSSCFTVTVRWKMCLTNAASLI